MPGTVEPAVDELCAGSDGQSLLESTLILEFIAIGAICSLILMAQGVVWVFWRIAQAL